MFCEALAAQDKATLYWGGGAVPSPLKESMLGELDALLTKDAVAEVVPLACGVNVAVNGTLCPAETVSGREMPLTANSELLSATELRVTLVVLVLLSVAEVEALLPTATLPRLKLLGLTLN